MGPGDVGNNGGHSRPTLIFLHIPKAAGSTFSSILEAPFDPKRTFIFRDPPADLERLKAVPAPDATMPGRTYRWLQFYENALGAWYPRSAYRFSKCRF